MSDGALDALETQFEEAMGTRTSPAAGVLARARAQADRLAAAGSGAAGAESLTASALVTLAIGSGAGADDVSQLVRRAERLTGADPLRIALLALADPLPLASPLDAAIQAHVTLLAGLGDLGSVALWRVSPMGAPKMAAAAGALPSGLTRVSVARVLCGDPVDEPAVLIRAFDEPCALLTWIAGRGDAATARVLAERSAALLGLAFERASLLDGTVAQHAAMARSAERRLSRVALDLHDGPLQDLALLRGELASLRATLEPGDGSGESPRDPLAQLDDLQAIAEATEADLRELATSMESSSLLQRPFCEALRGVARAFALRSGIEPVVSLSGAGDELSSMERGTLLRVVGEALANTRAHADAGRVEIAVHVAPAAVEATISDDGRGFDVEATLPAAARRGSLGLLGMVERVRQIGGTCHVDTRPGEGTAIRIAFARVFPQVVAPLQPGAGAIAEPDSLRAAV